MVVLLLLLVKRTAMLCGATRRSGGWGKCAAPWEDRGAALMLYFSRSHVSTTSLIVKCFLLVKRRGRNSRIVEASRCWVSSNAFRVPLLCFWFDSIALLFHPWCLLAVVLFQLVRNMGWLLFNAMGSAKDWNWQSSVSSAVALGGLMAMILFLRIHDVWPLEDLERVNQ